MAQVVIYNYNVLKIDNRKVSFPERVRQFEIFDDLVAVRVNAKKNDPEYNIELKEGGNIFIANRNGITWQYPKKGYIATIWKINEHTLGMYDGQTDIWVDINKLDVVRMIWNPWGLDNPEKYK